MPRKWERKPHAFLSTYQFRKKEMQERAKRANVLKRYAAMTDTGDVIQCSSSKYSKGKIVYETEQKARQAAAELFRTGNARPMEPYPCESEDETHFHLRTLR